MTRFWLAFSLMGLLPLGCSGDDNIKPTDTGGDGDADTDVDTDSDTDNDSDAMVRLVHLGPNAPAVDIYADSEQKPLVEDFTFTSGTGYVPLAPDFTDFTVTQVDNLTPVVELGVQLEDGGTYAAVAAGFLGDPNNALQLLAIPEDTFAIPALTTRLQFVHTASRTTGTVDVWNLTDAKKPVPLFTDVSFSGVGTADLPSDPLVIGIDTNDALPAELVFNIPDYESPFLVLYAVQEDANAGVFDVQLVAHLNNGTTQVLTAQ